MAQPTSLMSSQAAARQAAARRLRDAREAVPLTRAELAKAVTKKGAPCDVRKVKRWETKGVTPYPHSQRVICEVLETTPAAIGWKPRGWTPPGEQAEVSSEQAEAIIEEDSMRRDGPAVRRLPARREESGDDDDMDSNRPKPLADRQPRRREVLEAGLVAAASEALPRPLRETHAEAAEFTRRAASSNVGKRALEHLEIAVAELERVYFDRPPAEQFAVAFRWRRWVQQKIDGPHTLKEGRELYAHASRLSEHLAWRAHERGDKESALAWALDSFAHAEEAGHDEQCAWAANAMAGIAVFAPDPEREIKAALQGMRLAPAGHPVAVELRARAASGFARLGAREECEQLLAEAARLHDKLPARGPKRWSADAGVIAGDAMRGYAAYAALLLGDFRRARQRAADTLAAHNASLGASPQWEVSARVDLALALARLGEPEEAAALGGLALDSPWLAVHAVSIGVRELDAALMSRHPDVAEVRDLHERCLLAAM